MPLDIAVGVLLTFFTHVVFQVPLSGWLFALGIGAALLPDIDIVTAFFGRWRHRELTHYPIVYVPIAVALFIVVPIPYAALATAGIFAHLIHDTIGTGWGISWFWPFTDRRFLLLPYGKRREEMGIFATWLPEEKPEWAHHGAHTWVHDMYFRPSPIALIEYGALFIVFLTLLLYIW